MLQMIFFLLTLFLFHVSAVIASENSDKKFHREGNTLTSPNVRFQFLTPTLVRMEFSPSGKFVDAPTAVVLNRKWKNMKIETGENENRLTAKSHKLTLYYSVNSGKFTNSNLSIT